MLATAPAHEPLPTTRELGERFGVANTTVFRALRNLIADGRIWQQPTSGRYYPAAARDILHRPKPVACLVRRLELCSELYRELLEGVSAGCGERRRTMLLWHDELLVNHPDPHEPPRFAGLAQQQAILDDFCVRHGDTAGGFLLDHLWHDDALRNHAEKLSPGVVLFRHCGVDAIGNIAADFHAGALKALAHLLGRGYDSICPIEPFRGDPAVVEFLSALTAAADELGCRDRLVPAIPAHTTAARDGVIASLKRRSAKRTALLCPEDNVAMLLAESARAAGLRCPENVGVLTVMGTDLATRAKITCLRYDFREMGRRAVAALGSDTPVRETLAPQLVAGGTT